MKIVAKQNLDILPESQTEAKLKSVGNTLCYKS